MYLLYCMQEKWGGTKRLHFKIGGTTRSSLGVNKL